MRKLSRAMWLTTVAASLALLGLGVTNSATPLPAGGEAPLIPAAKDWSQANGDLNNTRYSTLNQINRDTVKNLGIAWLSDKFEDNADSRVTPVVKDGVMFITAGVKVYALDAKTGKIIWKSATTSSTVGNRRGLPAQSPNREGVAVAEGKVFVATMNAHMMAFDEKTGKLLWDEEVGEDITPSMRVGTSISSNPTVLNGVIYSAITFQEARFRGRMIALDTKTGHQIWHFNAVPEPGEPGHETWTKGLPADSPYQNTWKMGGADCWQAPVVDLDLGLVYYSTGNPTPNRQAGNTRPGNNLYASSTIALDIKTGKLRWYYQAIHHDMWEGDLGTANVGYDHMVNGTPKKGLAVLRPDGTVILLDRATGKPLWPMEERPVRQSELMKASPTQPYPVGRGSLTERPCNELEKVAPKGFIIRCESGLFQPFTPDPPNVLSYYPGVRNSPMSYSPQTGYIYLQGSDELTWNWVSNDPPTWDLGITSIRNRVPNIEQQDIMVYLALDPQTYKPVWKKTYKMPITIYGSGGFITTAGGLAFHRLDDGNLVAWDAKTGDELWKFQTGVPDSVTIQTATPMTYEVDGQQYVSIILRDQVWAFKLGGDMAQRQAPKLPEHEDVLAGPIQDTTTIRSWGANDFNFRYSITPFKARVKAGTEVTFLNNGSLFHDYVAEDGSFETGELLPRALALITFNKPGKILYHCKNHPWEYGMVFVTDANATTSAAPAAGRNGGGNFAAQAAAGKQVYDQQCSLCHLADLSGNDFNPALAGSAFVGRWHGKTAKALFDKVSTTMPTTAPGSLTQQQYLDLVGYLLQANSIMQTQPITSGSVGGIIIP